MNPTNKKDGTAIQNNQRMAENRADKASETIE